MRTLNSAYAQLRFCSFFKYLFILKSTCMSVGLCAFMYTTFMWVPREPEENIRAYGIKVTGGCS